MQLLIPIVLWERLLFQAQSQAPKECCGYLLGERRGEDNFLVEIFPMQNTHSFPCEHFSFSPNEQLRVLREFAHLQIIGVYHSHPDSKPNASAEDEAYMFFQTYSNLIISLKDGISFASYRKIKGKLHKEKVVFLTHFKYNGCF